MPKNENQKTKILAVMEILTRKTDVDHPMPLARLSELLEADYGIRAERKSLYNDLARLSDFGTEVLYEHGRGYYLASRPFELAELKLLADAVQACRFITAKKADGLIRKIASLAGEHDGASLARQVHITNRAGGGESLYNIDALHTAIREKKQVEFLYWEWSPDKLRVPRHGGERYLISPLSLVWDSEYYYLIAYDAPNAQIRHYRVDKMQKIRITGLSREGEAAFRDFDLNAYTDTLFGMFGGEGELVTLRCDDSLAGAVIDRFGEGVPLTRHEGNFTVRIRVRVSPLFLAYVIGFGDKMKVESPASVRGAVCHLAQETLSLYQ